LVIKPLKFSIDRIDNSRSYALSLAGFNEDEALDSRKWRIPVNTGDC
jgi:hypothetical protein